MRVLLTSAPLRGHLATLVPAGRSLRAAGHEVVLAVADELRDEAVRAGLTVVSTGPGPGPEGLAEAGGGIAHAPHAHGRLFGAMAVAALPVVTALVRDGHPDLVVSERAEFAGPVAAHRYGVAHVEMHWGVAELPGYRLGAAAELATELGGAGLPEPALRFDPWPPALRDEWARRHRDVRHVPYDGPTAPPVWLGRPPARPRVGLTMGTVLPRLDGGIATLRGLVDRLADAGVELVLALADDLVAELGPLPAAVVHAGWLPLAPLAASCALLVHHGGHGTTLTALAAGCPQVMLPVFDDQFGNAAAAATAGAGVAITRRDAAAADPDALAARCLAVLAEPARAAAARSVARAIAAMPGPATTVHALEDAAERGSTTLRAG